MPGSFCIVRQKKPVNRWSTPGVPEYQPRWLAMYRIPGEPRSCESTMYEICEECLAIPDSQSPTKVREKCRCQKPARKFAEETLKTKVHLWQERRMEQVRSLRVRKAEVTLGKVTDTYLANVPAAMAVTAGQNVSYLMAIVGQSTGLTRTEARKQSVGILTRQLALLWMRLRQAYNADMKLPKEERRSWAVLRAEHEAGKLPGLVTNVDLPGNVTINSMLRKAKGVIGKRARAFYLAGLELPELKDWQEVPMIAAAHGYEPLEDDVLQAIEQEAAGWRTSEVEEEREMWIAYQLESRFGWRPREVLYARRSWLEYEAVPVFRTTPGWILVVRNRPEEGFLQKARNKAITRRYVLDDELAEALVARDGWLVAPEMATSTRARLVMRVLSKRLRAHVGTDRRRKTNYELRKNYGSAVYTVHGKEAAAAQLGHASGSDVTEARYATRKGAVAVVNMDDLVGGSQREVGKS